MVLILKHRRPHSSHIHYHGTTTTTTTVTTTIPATTTTTITRQSVAVQRDGASRLAKKIPITTLQYFIF